MATVFTSDFCQTQITNIQAQIVAWQAALTALAANPNKAYSFDTGQSKETVTKWDAPRIRELINGLIGDLQMWNDCVNNTTSVIGRPGF